MYNASYMLPETLITVVGAVLLIKQHPRSSTVSTPKPEFSWTQVPPEAEMHPAGLFCTNLKKAVDNSPFSWYNNTRLRNDTGYGGLAQLGERLHGMQEVSGSIPLFSTKKALYFVGSMVLFFLLS